MIEAPTPPLAHMPMDVERWHPEILYEVLPAIVRMPALHAASLLDEGRQHQQDTRSTSTLPSRESNPCECRVTKLTINRRGSARLRGWHYYL